VDAATGGPFYSLFASSSAGQIRRRVEEHSTQERVDGKQIASEDSWNKCIGRNKELSPPEIPSKAITVFSSSSFTPNATPSLKTSTAPFFKESLLRGFRRF